MVPASAPTTPPARATDRTNLATKRCQIWPVRLVTEGQEAEAGRHGAQAPQVATLRGTEAGAGRRRGQWGLLA